MPKRVEPKNRIKQVSVGLERRQIDFLDKYLSYRDSFQRMVRDLIDQQIKIECMDNPEAKIYL
jgi:hypothetical protein